MGYYYFILFTFCLFSIQIVYGNDEVSANEESIKVLFPSRYKEKVVGCNIQILNDDDDSYFRIILRNKGYSYRHESGLEYIGDKDNTCSFILYPNHELFKQNQTAALRKKWKIIEVFQCSSARMGDYCNRGYNVFFNPQSFIEILSMSGAKTKIIRSAPYNNKTLTIRTSSEKQKIHMCRLFLHDADRSIWTEWTQIKYAFDIYPLLVENGIEYIGDQDNSCSFRVNLDFIDELNNRYNGFLNRYWTIQVTIYENDDPITTNYKFYMNSLSWWKNAHVSNVFLTKRILRSFDVQHY